MKYFNYLVVVFVLLFFASAYAYDAPELCSGDDNCYEIQSGDVWVISGDSITAHMMYSVYLEAYYQLRYPALDLRFRNAGIGSTHYAHMFYKEVVLEDDEAYNQYDRRVYAWEPDIVSTMMGKNGANTQSQYHDFLIDFVDDLAVAKNSAVSVLIPAHPHYVTGGHPSYEAFDEEVVTVGELKDVPYAPIFDIVSGVFDEKIAEGDTDGDFFGFVSDLVHPGEVGHALITYAILKELNVDTDVSQATINASTPTTTSQTDCTISNLTANSYSGIDFDRLDTRLPWSFDAVAEDLHDVVTDIPDLSKMMLTVTGLVTGSYDIYIDDELLANKTNTELAAGWNIAELRDGPYYDQGIEVLAKIRIKESMRTIPNYGQWQYTIAPPEGQGYKGVRAFTLVVDDIYNDDGDRGQDLIDSMETYVTNTESFDATIHSSATPVTREFRIQKSAGGNISSGTGTFATGTGTWNN